MNRAIVEQLKRHEGLRLKPYRCTADKLTIGYGRNLEQVGITEQEAEYLLLNDIKQCENDCLHAFPWFTDLNEARQGVLVNMCFNVGLSRLMFFKKFLAAMNLGNYNTAADEMLDSMWAEQVKGRAIELAAIIRTGKE